jgi:hypothetical protein
MTGCGLRRSALRGQVIGRGLPGYVLSPEVSELIEERGFFGYQRSR